MKYAVRLLVTALLVASVGFGVYYYFSMPDSNLSTYYSIVEYRTSDEFENLNNSIGVVLNGYAEENEGVSVQYTYGIEIILDDIYDYYSKMLLFVHDVSSKDQNQLNDKMQVYINTGKTTKRLVDNFNAYYSSDPDSVGISAAYNNFMNAYDEQLKTYYELIRLMQQYVDECTFDGQTPYSLNNYLLNAQLDFVQSIVLVKEQSQSSAIRLLTKLTEINDRYNQYENNPTSNNTILEFMDAYKNLTNKIEFFEEYTDIHYIDSIQNLEQKVYATTIKNFLENGFDSQNPTYNA